jgi:CMP-N,N'-diacetyllegionaminic acid synthase
MARRGIEGAILAVIPARGGSKGIPLKNLRIVAGKSLVQWAAEVARAIPEIDYSVVSTDNEEIAREAETHGLRAPFRRPPELSGDRISDLEVLRHAIQAAETAENRRFEFILMLQPTCPLRTASHVRECLSKLQDGQHDAAWTVSAVDIKFHPLKQLNLENGRLGYFDDRGAKVVARQELSETYIRNGACYAWRRCALMDEGTILPKNSVAVVIHDPLVNIDSFADLEAAERLLARREP